MFIAKGSEALVFHAGTLGCIVCLTPQLFLSVHPHVNLRLPSPPATALPTWSARCHLAMHHLCLSCPVSAPPTSLDKISSLTPWLSNFHMVWFSSSSGYFLFLNWLLSFFWLCEKTEYLPMPPSWLEVLYFHFWRLLLLDRGFLVDSFLSALWTYHFTDFWHPLYLMTSQLLILLGGFLALDESFSFLLLSKFPLWLSGGLWGN